MNVRLEEEIKKDELIKRVSVLLKKPVTMLRNKTYLQTIEMLVDKMENDCVDIDDMFLHLESLRERK
jgi:hypothetical protein